MNSTSHIFRWYTFVRHTQDDKLRINSRAFPFDKVKNSPWRSVYKWIEMFKHTHLLLPKKIQVSALCWKVFVDGVLGLLEHYMEKDVTVTSVNYCNVLRNELRPAIHSKRRGRLTQGVLLLHDNARPHTAYLTINTIRQRNWEVLEHLAYSPFRFLSVWTPQERSKRSSICSWWWGERGGAWLASQSTTNFLFQRH